MSGGDKHMLEVALRWQKRVGVGWVLPKLGYELNKNDYFSKFSDAHVYSTPWEDEGKLRHKLVVLLAYLWRMTRSSFLNLDPPYTAVVASCHYLFDTIPAIVFSRRLKVPAYVYIHHIIFLQRGQRGGVMSWFSHLNERLSFYLIKKFFAGIIVVSPLIARELVTLGFDQKKILISSNGVSLDFIETIPGQAKKYAASFVGRLTVNKGIYDLVKVWREVAKKMPEAKLAIVGDGPERVELEKAITEAEMPKNISLLGFVTEEEKIKVLKQSQLFLFPSPEEGWGIVIAEAMGCGLPVVAYDLPAYKEIFTKGIVKVEKGHWQKMAEEAIRLLQDGSRRLLLSVEASAQVQNYDLDLVAEKELRYLTG